MDQLHNEFQMYALHPDQVNQIWHAHWETRRAEAEVERLRRKATGFMSLFPDYIQGNQIYTCQIRVDINMVREMVGNMELVERQVLYEFKHLVQMVIEGKDANVTRRP